MSTTTIVPAPKHNDFIRFIDAVGRDIKKYAPVVETVAVDAEPILAFTPFGPEYNITVNAIVGAQKTAQASIAAGVNLTGTQKMALAVQAATPGLLAILKSRGVSESTDTHIANWIQTVFNILSGPVAAITKAIEAGATASASAAA